MKEKKKKKTKFKSRKIIFLGEPVTPKTISWILRVFKKWIKTERQAANILFFLAGLAIIISLYLFFGNYIKNQLSTPSVSPEGLMQKELLR